MTCIGKDEELEVNARKDGATMITSRVEVGFPNCFQHLGAIYTGGGGGGKELQPFP